MNQFGRPIKLFPLVLCRIGTLPYDLLNGICWAENDLLTVDLQIYQTLNELVDKKEGDKKQQQELRKKIGKFEANFELHYLQQQQLHRASFYAFSGHQLLQKGLLQSSPSLWEGLQRYRLQPPTIYRKKERQTERSLAQYLARICTKTSPFSTFTALSLNDLSGSNVGPDTVPFSSVIRINNYVLAQVEELLSAYPPFYKHLRVQINPTLRKKGKDFVFLINSRNVESIQQIEENEVLALILSIGREYSSGQLVFATLLTRLGAVVDASHEELQTYLSDLVRLGFLNWLWPVSGTNPNWNETLLEWITALPDFDGKVWMVAALDQLKRTADQLPQLPVEKRWSLIQESMTHLARCFEEIGNRIPKIQLTEHKAFVAFQNTDLAMSREKLFFEDTQMRAEISWSESDLEQSVEELSQLVEMVLPFRMQTELEEPLHFFKRRYNDQETVPLLQFYQDFYAGEISSLTKLPVQPPISNIDTSLSSAQEAVLAAREKITKELSKHITIDYNFTVHLPLSVLNSVMAPTQQKVAVTPSPESFGALLQLQRSSNGQYKSYVDAVFTGYGKMLGRFLHLFPKEKSTQLTDWVEQMRGTSLWVDNTDASFHNANAHPAFLQKLVSIPGGQQAFYNKESQLAEEQLLQLKDLSIRLSETENKLLLYCQEEEVTIFNFGLEALQSRSPMYRLLSSFCTTQPDITPLKMMLLQATRRKKGNWTLLPRVNVGDYLVLQRRAWFVPKGDLPMRGKSETEAAYFLRTNNWIMQNELPSSVFITLSPMEVGDNNDENNNRNTDGYKPQYIDFSSPALVSHLGRELKKVDTMLKIEEVLPGKGEMVTVNGRERAVELVVQWESIINH